MYERGWWSWTSDWATMRAAGVPTLPPDLPQGWTLPGTGEIIHHQRCAKSSRAWSSPKRRLVDWSKVAAADQPPSLCADCHALDETVMRRLHRWQAGAGEIADLLRDTRDWLDMAEGDMADEDMVEDPASTVCANPLDVVALLRAARAADVANPNCEALLAFDSWVFPAASDDRDTFVDLANEARDRFLAAARKLLGDPALKAACVEAISRRSLAKLALSAAGDDAWRTDPDFRFLQAVARSGICPARTLAKGEDGELLVAGGEARLSATAASWAGLGYRLVVMRDPDEWSDLAVEAGCARLVDGQVALFGQASAVMGFVGQFACDAGELFDDELADLHAGVVPPSVAIAVRLAADGTDAGGVDLLEVARTLL